MEVSLLWELGKSQQYNLTNRGKMKKRRKRGTGQLTRQGIYSQEHYIGIQIRRETKELLDEYCNKQREATGIKLSKVDIVDLAVRSIVRHDNFFQFAIDFKNKKK